MQNKECQIILLDFLIIFFTQRRTLLGLKQLTAE